MIHKEINQNTPEINGLLCIDCWEEDNLQSFYNNLDNYIDFSKIQSICVANYELMLDSRDLCQYNILEVYSWDTFNPQMLLPVMKESRFRKTSQWLQSKFSSNSFLLLDMHALKTHIETSVPHIKNWLIIGGSWQLCTHHRPVNLELMAELPYNYFITPWSIYNVRDKKNMCITEKDIEEDMLEYTRFQNNFFKITRKKSATA